MIESNLKFIFKLNVISKLITMKHSKALTVILTIAISIISLIAAFPGLAEFYVDHFGSKRCIDGQTDLMYKNCEYFFEYTIPTNNWITWDDKKDYAILPPVPAEPGLLTWAQNMYAYYDGSLPSAYMTVQVYDMVAANFTSYDEVKVYWTNYFEDDPDKELTLMMDRMNYTTYLSKWHIGNFTFNCTVYLFEREELLYVNDGCYDEGYIITPQLQKELHSMFKSFRFLN